MTEYAARRRSVRFPIGAPAKVRYPGVDDVFDATVGNVGMAGMFVASDTPMPAGTLLHFELRPMPHWRRLRGRGRVAWTRYEPSDEGYPSGMGVRFIELEEQSKWGLRWLIETYQEADDQPVEHWTVPEQFARSSESDTLVTQEIVPISESARAPSRSRPLGRRILAVAVGLAGLAGLAWMLRGCVG